MLNGLYLMKTTKPKYFHFKDGFCFFERDGVQFKVDLVFSGEFILPYKEGCFFVESLIKSEDNFVYTIQDNMIKFDYDLKFTDSCIKDVDFELEGMVDITKDFVPFLSHENSFKTDTTLEGNYFFTGTTSNIESYYCDDYGLRISIPLFFSKILLKILHKGVDFKVYANSENLICKGEGFVFKVKTNNNFEHRVFEKIQQIFSKLNGEFYSVNCESLFKQLLNLKGFSKEVNIKPDSLTLNNISKNMVTGFKDECFFLIENINIDIPEVRVYNGFYAQVENKYINIFTGLKSNV